MRMIAAALLASVGFAQNVPYSRILEAHREPQNWLTYSGNYNGQRHSQLDQINVEREKEAQLRTAFLDKKKQAIDLPAYVKQLEDIEKQFGALLKQLPGKSEMDALLTDINQAGLGRGLQFELFKPAPSETQRDFYAELPITIRVTGNYHDLGSFASDIGKLSRIVTLNDIGLSATKDTLVMDATAKTFRYLDEEEIATQRKAAAAAKGGKK